MISFSINEIHLSIGYAAGYGVAYSAIFSLCLLLRAVIFSLSKILSDIFKFEKIFPLPSFKKHIKLSERGAVFSFLSVIIFTLGFVLISYFALDGVLRVYMLVFAFASFYLSKFALFDFLNRLFVWIFDKLLMLLCLFLRISFAPIRFLFKFIKSRIIYFLRANK